MPRSIWKGAVSFGLVSIPIKVYGATEDKDVSFRQVHKEDGGRLIAQLEGKFDPTAYSDSYREALLEVVEARLAGAEMPEQPDTSAPAGDVVDLMAALQASVEAAKKRREEAEAS